VRAKGLKRLHTFTVPAKGRKQQVVPTAGQDAPARDLLPIQFGVRTVPLR
jgi:hypothetical protein